MRVRNKGKKVYKKYLENNEVEKATAKKRGRKSLYTEAERKEIRSLQSMKYRRMKKLENMQRANSYTMRDIRPMLSPELVQNMISLWGKGEYFQEPGYSSRDFREWMKSNGDEWLVDEILKEVNPLLNGDTQIGPDSEMTDEMLDVKKEIDELEEKINNIKSKANDRKTLEQLKKLEKELHEKKDDSIADMIDRGDMLIDAMSDPKKFILMRAKRKIAQDIISKYKDKLTEGQKSAISDAIIANPISGIRTLVGETVREKLTPVIGNDKADVVTSVVNLLTGGSKKSTVATSLFKMYVNGSDLNKSLMIEKAADMIESGNSTEDKEKAKMFGRDVLVTTVTEVLKSGGNVYAAVPKILGKLFFSAATDAVTKKNHKKEEPRDKKEVIKLEQNKAKEEIRSEEDIIAELSKFLI